MEKNWIGCDIEHHAVLFGLLAKEVMESCPENGVDVIRACVKKYGRERGGRMAQRCLANGDPCSPQNYQAYNERSSRPGQMNSVPAQRVPEFVIHVKKCAWVDAWKEHGLLDYGKYYCLDIDKSLTRGFSDDYEVQIGSWLSWGGDCCDMHWGFAMDDETQQYIAEKRASLSGDAIRGYDYHTGHMFSTIVTELIAQLGEDGKQVASRALTAFRERFSAAHIQEFADAYPLEKEAASVVTAVTAA